MHYADRSLALVAFFIFVPSLLHGQEPGNANMGLQGMAPGGLRTSVTESWGTLSFIVTNPNDTARVARVVVYYPQQPDVQYARDVWVPAQSVLTAWLPIGPAAKQNPAVGRTVEMMIYDRTDGQDRLLLPRADERIRSRAVLYKEREPSTTILLDDVTGENEPDYLFRPESPAYRALEFARTIRLALANGLSETVNIATNKSLPPMPAAFDGIDHFVLASNRLAADIPGQVALRQWVQHGGKLWVMLDLVDPQTIAHILGDDFDLPIIDRMSLEMETIAIHRERGDPVAVVPRKLNENEPDEPVAFVRVMPTPKDRVVHRVNGWPASFVRPVGRGKIIFTTLGAQGWHKPREKKDPKSPFENYPDMPVPSAQLVELVGELRPRAKPPSYTSESLRPILNEEIGYSVIDRRLVGGILGVFVLSLVGLGIGLRRSRRPELVGWLGPAAALIAAGLFVALGIGSRRAVPPTIAVAAVVDPIAGSGESTVEGLFAAYHPTSGPASIGTQTGGTLDLDVEGLEGQTRRRVVTDADAWHWDNLSLPAGVRSGPFHSTMRTGKVTAVASFGPNGLEGKLSAQAFPNATDAVITTGAKEPVAVRLSPDGSFTSGTAETLLPGQFLTGAVLSNQQQRRQAVYRILFTEPSLEHPDPLPEHMKGRDLLLAWAETTNIPFTGAEEARVVGTVLLVIPLEMERPVVGTHVTIPPAFIAYERVLDGGVGTPTVEATTSVNMRLRFQLPKSVLPMTVERATFVARVRMPGWRFAVSGFADGQAEPPHIFESPVEPVRVEIKDPRMLKLDERGGLHLNVAVGDIKTDGPDSKWKIDSLTLEVVGTTVKR